MSTGKINVTTENLFPIIKKFLYSDHEIFLRELVSNAVDACTKLQHLSSIGEAKGDLGGLLVEIIADKEAKTLTIRDNGLGMTTEEVEKYINQVAFSGAEEFVKKYDDKEGAGIIGHFGLGFYSSFMVSDKVEIFSKSFKGEAAAHWVCEGSPEFELEETSKETRGTDIVLHIAEDSLDFLEEGKISELLNKYCKFLPVAIKFGTRTEKTEAKEGEEAVEEVVDNIINNPSPAWTKSPSSLEDEDYKGFYRELYPMNFEDPLFHIHLNVDYPFNLTGILYFPKLKRNVELQKNKIQLYCNQVFVTDSVEGIVPDFLTLLHGVIDSPDIPLNVSRSYLQSDHNVKKISSHIGKKVADKLEELFKKDRASYEAKWEDIKVIIEYGMITDEKFYKRSEKFALYQNVDGVCTTLNEYKEKIAPLQTDKDGKLVVLYASNKDAQYSYIAEAKAKGYDVLLLDSPIVGHLLQKIESQSENVSFVRVDSDTVDNLIKKEGELTSILSEDEESKVKEFIESKVNKESFTVQFEARDSDASPFLITQTEFMRRMKEMSATGGGGGMMFGELPDSYNLVVNSNHSLVQRILNESDDSARGSLISDAYDLARLSQNLLVGEELTNFIKKSYDKMA